MTPGGDVSDSGTPFLPLTAVFSDPELGELFSEQALVESWLEVERALAAVQAGLGIIPAEAASAIAKEAVAAKVDRGRMWSETRRVGYPIVPLIEQVAAGSPPIVGAYIHWGATTQDVMDTGLVLQLGRALARIEALEIELGDQLEILAERYGAAVLPARTHAQQAVPTTFGVKLAVWLDELSRHLARLRAVRRTALVVQLFGAAGTAAALGPLSREVRHGLAERLRIGAADVPWHTVRDGIAEVGFALASVASTCGKIAREIIELSRTEIGEVREQPESDHGASSTMPQKSNPVLCETVVAESALARSDLASLLAAMQTGHERAAGEWQIEWDAVPRLFALAAGCLRNTNLVLGTLEVFPERMRSNLELDGGMVMSEAAMMALAPRIGRLRAHELVSGACRKARASGRALADVLPGALDPELLAGLPPLDELLAPEGYLGEADAIVAAAREHWAQVALAR